MSLWRRQIFMTNVNEAIFRYSIYDGSDLPGVSLYKLSISCDMELIYHLCSYKCKHNSKDTSMKSFILLFISFVGKFLGAFQEARS